jgi:transposase-like protein
MVVSIDANRQWLWRAVDREDFALDLLVQSRRDKKAAVRLMRKLLKKQGFAPRVWVTDKLRSYGAARRNLGLSAQHEQGHSSELWVIHTCRRLPSAKVKAFISFLESDFRTLQPSSIRSLKTNRSARSVGIL